MFRIIALMIIFIPSVGLSLGYKKKKISLQDIVSKNELQRDANQLVRTLGMNCATPDGIAMFITETYRILSGLARVVSESSLLLSTKKEYPNICHVMTQSHLDKYEEGSKFFTKKPCISKIAGKCVARSKVTTEAPQPKYYWPKYFIEVSKKGNDSHPSFAEGNKLFILNRKISAGLMGDVDAAAMTKLAAYVTGGSSLLSTLGIKTDGADLSSLAQTVALTPFQKMRVNSNGKDKSQHFEANIWPVALSNLFAQHFSVCGPVRIRNGQSPGGYTWKFQGVPMTCPVAMSKDAYSYWDTGFIDYMDPEAIAGIGIGSNPLTCGAAFGLKYLSEKTSLSNQGKAGETEKYLRMISKFGKAMSRGLTECSSPLIGDAAQIAKKAISFADIDKWKQVKCTPWGTMFPRSARSTHQSDYNFANTALKFKTLSHELFGVPRGQKERWSLAYPFETSFVDPPKIIGKLQELFKLGVTKNKTGRSYSLYFPGDPRLVDTSASLNEKTDMLKNFAKEGAYLATLAAAAPGGIAGSAAWTGAEATRVGIANATGKNITPGKKRIYTVWEEISCQGESEKVEVQIAGQTLIKKYKNCEAAIRFEVYKYIQTKLLRRICDLLGEEEGKPWR